MFMKNGYTFLLLVLSLFITSCSTYNKVHPLNSVCSYKDGVWGDWISRYLSVGNYISYDYSVRTQYDSQYLTVYIYKFHPAEYEIKIEIDKYSKKYHSKEWYSYNGKQVYVYNYVTEGTFDAYLWQTLENKQKFISQITCEFLCDETMVKSINKNGLKGTINSFYINSGYDKVGIGFIFR